MTRSRALYSLGMAAVAVRRDNDLLVITPVGSPSPTAASTTARTVLDTILACWS
jgi:hypothetical protein